MPYEMKSGEKQVLGGDTWVKTQTMEPLAGGVQAEAMSTKMLSIRSDLPRHAAGNRGRLGAVDLVEAGLVAEVGTSSCRPSSVLGMARSAGEQNKYENAS